MKVQTGDLKWKEVFLKPAGDTLPVGSITEFGGSVIPKNWLKCDGKEVSRTSYPHLFKVIGTAYGEGDGSTTFNLPTMESENAIIIIKAKNSLGAAANVVETAESDYYDDVPNAKAVRDYVKEHGVIVSPTEPTTGEEVWIKKGKNLFNKNAIIENYYLDYINGIPTWDSNMAYMESYIDSSPNTKYTMSANAGTIFVIYEYDENKNFIGYKSQNTEATSYTMTTEETTKYVRLALGKSMKDVIQFELGETATDYEPYVDKEIYVKNDNGVYEEYIKPQVKVSPIEPTTGEDIWIKKGNNLWTGGSSFVVNATNTIDIYLRKGTYTLSVGSVTTNSPSARAHVSFKNAAGETFLTDFLGKSANAKRTFTLEQDAVRMTLWSGDYWTASSGYQTTYNNLMLVSGKTALPYEDFMDKAIYVKNYNDKYDELVGVEKLKGVVLYSGSTTEDITLSDSVLNYNYIEIHFRDSDNVYNSVKIYAPNGKKVSLTCIDVYGASGTFFKGKLVNILENTISNGATSYNETKIDGTGTIEVKHTNLVYITRVIGYKH